MANKYDEIRDLLAMNKLPEVSGKGVSQEEIALAEITLGVRLPDSYRMFLKEHGWGDFGLPGLIAGLGSDIPQEWRPGINLLQVVGDERIGPSRFPIEIIPFCPNGAGDWYALDCSQSDGHEVPVVFVAHEEVATGGFAAERCADSFADWISSRLSENE